MQHPVIGYTVAMEPTDAVNEPLPTASALAERLVFLEARVEHLATRDEVQSLAHAIREELQALQNATKQEFQALRADLPALEARLANMAERLEHLATKDDIHNLQLRLDRRLMWVVGVIAAPLAITMLGMLATFMYQVFTAG